MKDRVFDRKDQAFAILFRAPGAWLSPLSVFLLMMAMLSLGGVVGQRGVTAKELLPTVLLLTMAAFCLGTSTLLRHRSLQRQAAQMHSFLDRLADLAIVLDASGHISFVTESIRRYGQNPDVLIGKHLTSIVAPDMEDEVLQMLRHPEAGTSSAPASVKLDFDPLASTRCHFRGTLHRLTIARNERIVLLVNDVTAQERLHQQMAILNRMGAVAQLSAGVAHNFNNVLAGIMLNTSLLVDAVGDERLRLAERINGSAERGAKLCRKLLTFARGVTPTPGPILVLPMLLDLVTLFETETNRYRVTVEVAAEPFLVLHADRPHIEQILLDLLFNAREAIGSDGRIVLSAAQEEDTITISISNSGPPIPPELIPIIFLPFYSTKTDSVQGTGMGLAVCQSLARGMGGSIEVESLPELTTFTLRLPASSTPRD